MSHAASSRRCLRPVLHARTPSVILDAQRCSGGQVLRLLHPYNICASRRVAYRGQ